MDQDRSKPSRPVILPAATATFPLDDGGLTVYAPAKINLNLLVGPRGGDGFHPIDSLVAKVTLYDCLKLHPRDDGEITLRCGGAGCGPPRRNLAMRAAELLARDRSVGGVDIVLDKSIGPGAGLGGGSSDAAATLRGLNEMWGLRLDDSQLSALAAELGSDASLFLGPPAVRITGRGERVEPVELHGFTAVIVMIPVSCTTADVYAAYDRLGVRASQQLDIRPLGDCPPSQWRGRLHNDLRGAAEDVCPKLAVFRARLQAAIDAPVCMTGSGSAMFILCDDLPEAADIIARLDDDLQSLCVVTGLNPW